MVAERGLEFIGADGSTEVCRVVLNRPVQEGSDGTWFCPYSIEAQSFQRKSRAAGEDSLRRSAAARGTASALDLSTEQEGCGTS